LLVAWTAVTLLLGWRYWRIGQIWNATYHQMTSDLAERMAGHRTRLAQEDRQRWHTDEDAMLANYLEQSEELDQIQVQLRALVARGWMVVGLAGLAYPFITAQPTQAQLLIGLGGVLLASQSLNSLAEDIVTLITGMLAWQQVQALVKVAGANGETIAAPVSPGKSAAPDGQVPVLIARNLVFRYRARARDSARVQLENSRRRSRAIGRSIGRRQVNAGGVVGRITQARIGTALVARARSADHRRGQVAAQRGGGAAISREPRLYRNIRF
jgi:ATP-binding cassette subfamily B protein